MNLPASRFARKTRIADHGIASYFDNMHEDLHWRQVLARDARQDGHFVFAVRTTGIYCRPSCPSRRPRRDSVEFFANTEQAERAGYRACLRCKPTQISEQALYVAKMRTMLDSSEDIVTLGQLSKAVGLSRFHLQRLFKRATGLTPREYQAARRVQKFKTGLRKGDDVTRALYDAGYSSSSRLYETANQQFGMTPGAYRRGGAGMIITFTITPSLLGRMLIAATDRGLCAVRFGESVRQLEEGLRREFSAAELRRDDKALQSYLGPLLASLEGGNTTVDLPLDLRATAFQKKVWESLRHIPRGETRSYTEIARALGSPSAVRAVARACASNPVALAVPCHRVIRSDGELAGYRWGIDRQRKLLKRERSS